MAIPASWFWRFFDRVYVRFGEKAAATFDLTDRAASVDLWESHLGHVPDEIFIRVAQSISTMAAPPTLSDVMTLCGLTPHEAPTYPWPDAADVPRCHRWIIHGLIRREKGEIKALAVRKCIETAARTCKYL